MNLYHDVPRGDDPTNELNVIIEIPAGSYNKYEVDKDTGLIMLDRVNYNAAPYPFNYGYVPQTLWEDGDALDVIVLATHSIDAGVLVTVRPIALLSMNDGGDSDDKVLAVPVNDKRWDGAHDLDDLNPHSLKEFKHFFETYKLLKKDGVSENPITVHGYKKREAAVAAIETSITAYDDK